MCSRADHYSWVTCAYKSDNYFDEGITDVSEVQAYMVCKVIFLNFGSKFLLVIIDTMEKNAYFRPLRVLRSVD